MKYAVNAFSVKRLLALFSVIFLVFLVVVHIEQMLWIRRTNCDQHGDSRLSNYYFKRKIADKLFVNVFIVRFQLTKKSDDFLNPNCVCVFFPLRNIFFAFVFYFLLYRKWPNVWAKQKTNKKTEDRIYVVCMNQMEFFRLNSNYCTFFFICFFFGCFLRKMEVLSFISHMSFVFVNLFLVLKCLVIICLIFHSEFFIFFSLLLSVDGWLI